MATPVAVVGEGGDDVDAVARAEDDLTLVVEEVVATGHATVELGLVQQAALAADADELDLGAVALGQPQPEEADLRDVDDLESVPGSGCHRHRHRGAAEVAGVVLVAVAAADVHAVGQHDVALVDRPPTPSCAGCSAPRPPRGGPGAVASMPLPSLDLLAVLVDRHVAQLVGVRPGLRRGAGRRSRGEGWVVGDGRVGAVVADRDVAQHERAGVRRRREDAFTRCSVVFGRLGDDQRPVEALEHLVRRGVVVRVVPVDARPGDDDLVEVLVAGLDHVLRERRAVVPCSSSRCRASGCRSRARGGSRSARSACRPPSGGTQGRGCGR